MQMNKPTQCAFHFMIPMTNVILSRFPPFSAAIQFKNKFNTLYFLLYVVFIEAFCSILFLFLDVGGNINQTELHSIVI